jgi:hypothetical protein
MSPELAAALGAIRAEADCGNVATDQWVSETEIRLRNSIPNADTLPSRASGYTWGRRDESVRLTPLITKLTAALEKAMEGLRINLTPRSTYDEVLAILKGEK